MTHDEMQDWFDSIFRRSRRGEPIIIPADKEADVIRLISEKRASYGRDLGVLRDLPWQVRQDLATGAIHWRRWNPLRLASVDPAHLDRLIAGAWCD